MEESEANGSYKVSWTEGDRVKASDGGIVGG